MKRLLPVILALALLFVVALGHVASAQPAEPAAAAPPAAATATVPSPPVAPAPAPAALPASAAAEAPVPSTAPAPPALSPAPAGSPTAQAQPPASPVPPAPAPLPGESGSQQQPDVAPAQQGPGGIGAILANPIVMMLLMFAIIYFMLIRPQSKKRKEHQSWLDSLQRGDTVVTQGGIIGKITGVADKVVTIEVAHDVRMRVLRSHILGPEPGAGSTGGREESKAAKGGK